MSATTVTEPKRTSVSLDVEVAMHLREARLTMSAERGRMVKLGDVIEELIHFWNTRKDEGPEDIG